MVHRAPGPDAGLQQGIDNSYRGDGAQRLQLRLVNELQIGDDP